jgi:hypothetical protein
VEATELSLPDNDAKTDADLYPDPEMMIKYLVESKFQKIPAHFLQLMICLSLFFESVDSQIFFSQC